MAALSHPPRPVGRIVPAVAALLALLTVPGASAACSGTPEVSVCAETAADGLPRYAGVRIGDVASVVAFREPLPNGELIAGAYVARFDDSALGYEAVGVYAACQDAPSFPECDRLIVGAYHWVDDGYRPFVYLDRRADGTFLCTWETGQDPECVQVPARSSL